MNRHQQESLIDFTHTNGDQRAVVIGAGMGGLLAARVLADHYDHVLVLDRDTLPGAPAQRKNVPQGHHVHALLSRGRAIIESLFPGIAAELTARGALLGEMQRDLTWFQNGGYLHDPACDLTALMLSRPLLETHLRGRVASVANVTIVDDCQVTGLLATRNRQRVLGVRTKTGADPETELELRAALTIDASGRGSRLPTWLEQLGYTAPERVAVGVESRYATRLFRRTPGVDPARLATVIVASPAGRRGGVMIAQEDDRWIVSLASRNGAQPPTELGAFIEFARTLEVPDIYNVVRQAEPLDDGAIYRYPKSQRRYYERMERFPEGVLPFADAICSFNPVYGQGMSVAAIAAEHLPRCLGAGEADLAQRFFAGVTAPVDSVWKMTNSGDLRYTDEPVKLSPPARFLSWYLNRLLAAAQHDGTVSGAFQRVTNLVDMPPSLLRPNIALRVAFGRLRHPSSPATLRASTDLTMSSAD